MQWLNEPPQWSADRDVITVTAAPHTDFWRITHDNGQRDSGHVYAQRVTGDFVSEVTVRAAYAALYDQAGLMVRLDATTWMKCGIEFFDGAQHVSAVVTRDASDWSVVPVDPPPPALYLRVTRHDHTLDVTYSLDGAQYRLLRQAFLTREPTLDVGVMVCAPIGDGFTARFEGFRVTGQK